MNTFRYFVRARLHKATAEVATSTRLKILLATLAILLLPFVLITQDRLQSPTQPFQLADITHTLAATVRQNASAIGSITTPTAGAASVPAAAATNAPVTALVAAGGQCSRPPAFEAAHALDLTSVTGLKESVDTPSYYRVYGSTPEAIQQQISRCTPIKIDGQQFAAETNYAITWRYSVFTDPATNQCRLLNPAVGVHIRRVLPDWSAAANASAHTRSTWQQYISSLSAHEDEHVQLDLHYAQRILHLIQTYSEPDCEGVKPRIQAELTALDRANAAIDHHTNHGATQGAVL